jgi:hypothetical protein
VGFGVELGVGVGGTGVGVSVGVAVSVGSEVGVGGFGVVVGGTGVAVGVVAGTQPATNSKMSSASHPACRKRRFVIIVETSS